MKVWLAFKIISGLIVVGITTFTGLLAYHIAHTPLGGKFEEIIPKAGSILQGNRDEGFAKALEAEEMPDFEPGDKAFQKAHELIALGEINEGKQKLVTIISLFSNSPSAPAARKILSAINLDEVLSISSGEDKVDYTVKSGDSYYAIASRENTTLDMIFYLNEMLALRPLQPGDKLRLKPLNYRIIIDLDLRSVALWKDAQFVADYPIRAINGATPKRGTTQIKSKRASIAGNTVASTSENYPSADKVIELASPSLQIMPYDPNQKSPAFGIFLKREDIEELFLLTRNGNTVEIRVAKK